MAHKVTLGGDRLGSGKKMKVEIRGFERSTHDLSYLWRSTMSAGTLVPFLKEVALPGDTFDIHLNCDVKTHPTVGPLFGSYKVQLDTFLIPMRLYNAALHNNKLNVGMNMASVKLPIFGLSAPIIDPLDINKPSFDLDNAQVNPSSIMAYLGIRGMGIVSIEELQPYRLFNAIPHLAYWDIYKQYYANKQEEIGAVISIWPSYVNPLTITSITTTVGISPSAGTTIPQAPTTVHNVVLSAGSQIIIAYTGAAPNPDTIMVQQENTGLKVSATALVTYWVDNGTTLTGTFDAVKWVNFKPINWGYPKAGDSINIPPRVETFDLANIDLMRELILQEPFANTFNVSNQGLAPYDWAYQVITTEGGKKLPTLIFSQEGLGIKTYQSDLFNNWLSTEWIDGTGGINDITAIDTSSGSFNLDTLNLSKKVYDMLNAIAVSGGSYNDWVEANWDQVPFSAPENPVYMGGLIKELVFQEVVSNSATSDGNQPLGTLAGKGVMGAKHKGGTVVIKVTEPSYIMGIISLTPRIDYSQGNKWDVHLRTLDDLHKPFLDEIGFQELITEQMAWYTSYLPIGASFDTGWVQNSAGKQPAWINYMTNVNQVLGNFAIADNEMFMTLNRRYERWIDGTGHVNIKDLTTYIDPVKFNHIFADTAIDAQNFWCQISVDMIARRKMSAKVMPNF